jgi:hypothetical protein
MDKQSSKSNNEIQKAFDYVVGTINNSKISSYPINTINIRNNWVGARNTLDELTKAKYSQKYIPKIGKSVKAGTLKLGTSLNIGSKDLIKISNKAGHISDILAKKLLFGSTSKKQLAKINRLKNMSKPFKNVSNIAGKIMNNSVAKKIGGTLGKAFTPMGTAMNINTFQNKKNSNFKRLLAGADILGDVVSKLPAPAAKAAGLVTSTLNFAGGLAYDFFDSDLMKRFGGKKVTGVLDKGAGVIVKPVDKLIETVPKMWNSMKKGIKSIKQKGLAESLKSGINIAKQKTPEPLKKALKGYANMYLHPIQTWKKAGAFLANKTKNMFKKPKLKDYNDIYHRNLALSKNKQPAINHSGEVVQTKLQGGQIDNSNKNNFTININGTNKSTQEIMNEIVPEIKLRMKNISVA